MAKHEQIIEINGRRYDALTGQSIDSKKSTLVKPKPLKNPTPGMALDGLVGKARATPPHGHTAQKSKTLMRPAVKKPSIEPAESDMNDANKIKAPNAAKERLQRAKKISKSTKVSRFNKHVQSSRIVTHSANLPVKNPPPKSPRQQTISKSSTTVKFERAMHQATSHLQPHLPKSRRRSRRLKFALGSAASVFVLSFFAWQLIPTIKVRYAGSKAGFSASLPDYNPAGFGLTNDIATSNGEVSLTYASGIDKKSYKITQSPSNWTSQTLLNNYVIPTNKPYQTYQDLGRIVFIYDNSNATWVDGGIWYRLEGNASLTSDQLLRIASGL